MNNLRVVEVQFTYNYKTYAKVWGLKVKLLGLVKTVTKMVTGCVRTIKVAILECRSILCQLFAQDRPNLRWGQFKNVGVNSIILYNLRYYTIHSKNVLNLNFTGSLSAGQKWHLSQCRRRAWEKNTERHKSKIFTQFSMVRWVYSKGRRHYWMPSNGLFQDPHGVISRSRVAVREIAYDNDDHNLSTLLWKCKTFFWKNVNYKRFE